MFVDMYEWKQFVWPLQNFINRQNLFGEHIEISFSQNSYLNLTGDNT